MTLPVWCVRCKVAWMQEVLAAAELAAGAITAKAKPVRCPRCSCHRAVRRVEHGLNFERQHPEVCWLK